MPASFWKRYRKSTERFKSELNPTTVKTNLLRSHVYKRFPGLIVKQRFDRHGTFDARLVDEDHLAYHSKSPSCSFQGTVVGSL